MKNINCQKKAEEIQQWIKKAVTDTGFDRVLVAVSGGVDSAVTLTLAVRILGKEHVYAVLLPNGKMSTRATLDGKLVVQSVGLPRQHIFQRDISKAVTKIIKQAGGEEISDIRKGNIMARVRMIFLYDLAKTLNALVVGTENKSEYYLGYFTRFGDEASDIEPIRGLYKTQVWEMAKYLGVPEKIITKPPTAGLWEGQTDEKEFGFSYMDADQILYHYFDEGLPEEGIVALGLKKELVKKVLQRVASQNFKHHLPQVME